MVDENGSFEALKVYGANASYEPPADDDGDPGAQLLRLAQSYMSANRCDLREALAAVSMLPAGRDLIDAYNRQAHNNSGAQPRGKLDRELAVGSPRGVVMASARGADVRIHTAALKLLAEGKFKDYASAAHAVLDRDPALVSQHAMQCRGRTNR